MAVPKRQLRALLVTLAMGAAFLGVSAGPASADCDGVMASFREYAHKARLVVIGDVIATDPDARWTDDEGRSSRFTFRVRHVVKGPTGTLLELRDRPYLDCADHIITVKKGDRIAIAIDARIPGPLTVDIAAWIRGTAHIFGAETLTEREVVRLMFAAPDTSTLATNEARGLNIDVRWLVIVGLLGFGVTLRRLRLSPR